MKKLQIMAGMLSVLLLTGCGGPGTPTNTDNLPQTSATDASEATTTQNGNEYASEETAQGQDEKPCASDAAPGQVTEKDSSAGDEKPAGNSPSAPAGSGTDAEETPAPQPEEKGFDMDYWLGYAKDYAVGIGLRLDENATDSWDTPIRCSSKTEDVLAAYIRDDLTYYKNEEGCTAVWIWAEQVGDGQYELFIGRG